MDNTFKRSKNIRFYLYLSLSMGTKFKNIKVSDTHHELLKKYCDKNGYKIHKIVEKMIDNLCKPKSKDIYGEN